MKMMQNVYRIAPQITVSCYKAIMIKHTTLLNHVLTSIVIGLRVHGASI